MSTKDHKPIDTIKAKELLVSRYGEPIGFEHHGPKNLPQPHNYVFKSIVNDQFVFIKGFTDVGAYWGKYECEVTKALYTYSHKYDTSISAPEVIIEANDPCYHFITREIVGDTIDFTQLSITQLTALHKELSSGFDRFIDDYGPLCNRYNLGRYSKQLSSLITLLSKYQKKIKLINKAMIALLGKIELQQVSGWIKNGEQYGFIQQNIIYNKKQIISLLKSLLEKIPMDNSSYHFANGSMYGGKLFEGMNGKKIMIDLDRVGPQFKGKDYIGLIRSRMGLNTSRYKNFEHYQSVFEQTIADIDSISGNPDLSRLLIFCKLIGTAFNDYGYLMLSHQSNRSSITAHSGMTPEDNAREGINWNFELLHQMYGVSFTVKNT
ncbi:MAG TPA: hypothetical protein PLW93_03035 [Candidatus Absconditabacterales bacterium]|nr:hypothetical protein [Candidatus Absconditabacterales bacterium]